MTRLLYFCIESPASPEPMNEYVNFVVVRQPNNLPEYKLIPFDIPPKDASLMTRLLQLSISDSKLSNDPRIKKLLSNQFDAVSDMISSQNAAKDQSADVGIGNKDPRAKSDPRTAQNSRDPRLKPITSYSSSGSSPPQHQFSVGVGGKLDNNMIYGVNQMMPQQPMVMPMNFNVPPTMGSGVVTTANFVPTMQPPVMMNTGSMYMPTSSMMMSGNGMGNMPNVMPNMNANVGGVSSVSSWMPQVANVPQSPMGSWMPQQSMMMNSNSQDLIPNQRYNGPVSMGQMPPAQSYSGPVMDIQSKDPRSRRNVAPGRSYPTESSVDYSPPSQTNLDSGDSNVTSPPSMNDRLLPNVHRSGSISDSSGSLSLREKRKNMEFESPLSSNSFGAKSGNNSDENRYNTYSGSVKLKKKESVED